MFLKSRDFPLCRDWGEGCVSETSPGPREARAKALRQDLCGEQQGLSVLRDGIHPDLALSHWLQASAILWPQFPHLYVVCLDQIK